MKNFMINFSNPQSIPWYLDDKVVTEIIKGVYDAVEEKQRQYTVNTKVNIFYLLTESTFPRRFLSTRLSSSA